MGSALPRLNVDYLPQSQVTYYRDAFNLHNVVNGVLSEEAVANFWVPAGVVRPTDSLGFAVVNPELAPHYGEQEVWDNPDIFTWFVYHWGPQGRRYAANAVRKLRGLLPLIPQGRRNTLNLPYNLTVHPVITDTSGEDGKDKDFAWATFAKGGAVAVEFGDPDTADGFILPGAVSCFAEEEDPAPAYAALAAIGGKMVSYHRIAYS